MFRIGKAMRNEIADKVKDELEKNAKSIAGGTGRSRGIADRNMYRAEVFSSFVGKSAMTLHVYPEALPSEPVFGGWPMWNPASETQFAEWIERGGWMDLEHFLRTGEKIKRPARPFVGPTQEYINTSGIVEDAIRSMF